jgi:hypothetical protein
MYLLRIYISLNNAGLIKNSRGNALLEKNSQEVDTAAYLHRGMTNADMEDFRRFLISKKKTKPDEEEVLDDLPGDEKLTPQEKIKKQRERKVNPLYDEWKKSKKPVKFYLLRWWQKFVRGPKAIYKRFMALFRKNFIKKSA